MFLSRFYAIMDSFRIPFRLFLLILYIPTLLSSLPLKEFSKEKGIVLKAPLIHWSSPESPFYEPNLTPGELTQASVRSSRARANRIHNIRSGNISNSRKYPVSLVNVTDKVYVMKFSIGTPPVETYAIPDTGSTLVWIQCGSPFCTNCYKQRIPLFYPSESSTNHIRLCGESDCKQALWILGEYLNCKPVDKVCKYAISYEDDSFSEGTIHSDIFTFPEHIREFGNYTLRVFYGCGFNNSAAYEKDRNEFIAPGIVGLSNQMSSLVGQLTLGQMSYCIASPGGFRPDNYSLEIRFGLAASISGPSTALASNLHGWYIFKNVDAIYVDEQKVDGYPEWVFQFAEGGIGGLMLDTGTTYTELYFSAFLALVRTVKEHIGVSGQPDFSNSNFSLCYDSDQFLSFYLPSIELRFSDDKETYFPITISNAWIQNGFGQSCLAIFGTNGMSIIGMYQQRDIKIGYDLKNNLVSFTESFGCFIGT